MLLAVQECEREGEMEEKREGGRELQCARMCSYKLQLVRNVCQSELSEIGIQDCVTE